LRKLRLSKVVRNCFESPPRHQHQTDPGESRKPTTGADHPRPNGNLSRGQIASHDHRVHNQESSAGARFAKVQGIKGMESDARMMLKKHVNAQNCAIQAGDEVADGLLPWLN
jgi:hypothetical protein